MKCAVSVQCEVHFCSLVWKRTGVVWWRISMQRS
jgi:hypothetical protein